MYGGLRKIKRLEVQFPAKNLHMHAMALQLWIVEARSSGCQTNGSFRGSPLYRIDYLGQVRPGQVVSDSKAMRATTGLRHRISLGIYKVPRSQPRGAIRCARRPRKRVAPPCCAVNDDLKLILVRPIYTTQSRMRRQIELQTAPDRIVVRGHFDGLDTHNQIAPSVIRF